MSEPEYINDLNALEPGRDDRIWSVLDDAMEDLVEWRFSGPHEDHPDVQNAAERLYGRLARLPYPDLLRATVLLLMETERYGVRIDARHELASTVTVPDGWQS